MMPIKVKKKDSTADYILHQFVFGMDGILYGVCETVDGGFVLLDYNSIIVIKDKKRLTEDK